MKKTFTITGMRCEHSLSVAGTVCVDDRLSDYDVGTELDMVIDTFVGDFRKLGYSYANIKIEVSE